MRKLLLIIALSSVLIGCEKTIHEVRTPGPTGALASAK